MDKLNISRMQRRSVFIRIAMFCSIIVLLTILIFGLSVQRHLRQTFYKDELFKAEVVGKATSRVISKHLTLKDYAKVVDFCLEEISSSENLSFIVVKPNEGKALIHYAGGWKEGEVDSEWDRLSQGGEWYKVVPNPYNNGRCLLYSSPVSYISIPLGTVYVGYNLNQYEQNVQSFTSIIVILGLISLGIGIVLSLVFSRQITRPIKTIRGALQKISSGDLTVKIDVESNDEFAELAHTVNQMTGQLKDSRDQLQASMEQKQALREKEVLLKEIHHRVKNNMQVLSSMIRMQARRSDNEESLKFFKESETRIRSMSLIHEKLYQSEELSTIAMRPYLESLVRELRLVYSNNNTVKFKISADESGLIMDSALPVGLIVNELVSNSLKYAFPDRYGGLITVAFNSINDREYKLSVSDNGIGTSESGLKKKGSSLGLKLVKTLSNQLGGKVVMRNRDGFCFEVVFSEMAYKERV